MDFEAKKLMDLENRLTVAKGDGERGMDWESGVPTIAFGMDKPWDPAV